AYLGSREVFGLVPLWQQIEALDNIVADEIQAEMVIALRSLIAHATTWFLRSRRLFEPTQQQVARFAPVVQALRSDAAQAADSARAARWVTAGVPPALAAPVAVPGRLPPALDVADAAAA